MQNPVIMKKKMGLYES